jgi:hypothetical protein
VTVHNCLGEVSALRSADHFTYLAPIAVTAISPNSGGGGTVVTISGTGFVQACAGGLPTAQFGSVPASVTGAPSDGVIKAVAPAQPIGTLVDVVVTNCAGQSSPVSPADRFTYVNRAPTAGLSGSPTAGTWPLTVTYDTTGTGDPDGNLSGWTISFGDGNVRSGTGSPPATITWTYTRVGVYTATLTVTDAAGLTATATGPTIRVDRRVTALRALPVIWVHTPLAILITMSARLTDAATGQPLAGAPVTMSAGILTCTATTDANGWATCTCLLPIVGAVLDLGYTATFRGNASYLPIAARGSLL